MVWTAGAAGALFFLFFFRFAARLRTASMSSLSFPFGRFFGVGMRAGEGDAMRMGEDVAWSEPPTIMALDLISFLDSRSSSAPNDK